ncbi:hypothetical protein FNV43_RR09430 [Rhamnella rubrinervis]|uniref:Fungal lipase-like domain-containing protein n=1 Tax=Rhamnella rubrinervis TaxID=2594499 RepID=A0A8K0MJZ4_9ROSA|nr:hypothetical protein FNV43_RR09430 [Rhamnella rubrinervis]
MILWTGVVMQLMLKFPWVGVVNLSQADINKNVDMFAARRRERDYFTSTPEYKHLAHRMGIQSLIGKTISDLDSELARLGKPIAADAGLLRNQSAARLALLAFHSNSHSLFLNKFLQLITKYLVSQAHGSESDSTSLTAACASVDHMTLLQCFSVALSKAHSIAFNSACIGPHQLNGVRDHEVLISSILFKPPAAYHRVDHIGVLNVDAKPRIHCMLLWDIIIFFQVSSVSPAAQNRFRGISSGRMGRMRSGKERFELWGPLHLTTFIDWTNENHRRSVLACLIQGIYVHERDRQKKRKGPEALAPLWWESFHFKLLDNLIDNVDGSIFGGIYEFKPPPSISNHSLDGSPKYVIAFRGNFLKFPSFARDIELDCRFFKCEFHLTSRFQIAMQAVRQRVAAVGVSNVWLAGHSLGSAIAMLAGKKLASTGTFLSSYLFNPPYVSFSIESIKGEIMKLVIRTPCSFISSVRLASTTKGKKQESNQSDNPFAALSAWFPSLYVNPGDHICSKYIGYFEHKGRLATQISIGGPSTWRDTELHTESLHIPSANLITNSAPSRGLKEAHGIHQWWSDDLQLQSKDYKYK